MHRHASIEQGGLMASPRVMEAQSRKGFARPFLKVLRDGLRVSELCEIAIATMKAWKHQSALGQLYQGKIDRCAARYPSNQTPVLVPLAHDVRLEDEKSPSK